jgi:uncharacterized membrane protein YraQ (UPF0718 family)
VALVVLAVAFLVIGALPSGPISVRRAVGDLSLSFVGIVLEALPFVMLGSLIGGFIEVFVSRERVTAWLPRNRTVAVFIAAGLGLLIPVCECAVIPVTRRLVRKGIPFSVAVAYLLGGPIVNPLVATSTLIAYSGDWVMVVARLVCGFGIAVFVALLVDELFPGHKALRPGAAAEDAKGACGCGDDHPHAGHGHEHVSVTGRVFHALEHAADDFLDISQFLIIGALVAGLSQSLIARPAFLALAETPAAAILVMMLLAVVLNLCSEADAFVAASFRGVLPESAQLAFMVLGPMIDLKLIAMYLSFVRKRALLVLVALVGVLVFGMALVLEIFGARGA